MGLWLTKSVPSLSQKRPPVVEKAPFWELGGLAPLHIAWLSTFKRVQDSLRDAVSPWVAGPPWGRGSMAFGAQDPSPKPTS